MVPLQVKFMAGISLNSLLIRLDDPSSLDILSTLLLSTSNCMNPLVQSLATSCYASCVHVLERRKHAVLDNFKDTVRAVKNIY